jgi:subtilase family protein
MVVAAASSPAMAQAPAAGVRAAAGSPGRMPGPVLLINGFQLAVLAGAGSRPVTALIPPKRSALAGSTVILTMGRPGHLSEVPADALPFLGRGLDPALFSVAALRRAEHGGRLPVLISYRGRVPSLPGVTITHASAGTAEGFVTARSAPRFGAALHRQFLADHDRAAYGSDGLFGHGVSIALAGAQSPGPVRPRFVMHTLTLHATSLAGRPDNGDFVFLTSADDIRRVAGSGVFRHGIARVSVPAGHYWATGLFFHRHRFATVFPPQFTVRADGPQPLVQVDGRTATSVVRIAAPRPATVDVLSFTTVLHGRTGPAFVFGDNVIGDLNGPHALKFAVSPASFARETGRLQTFTQAQLSSPRGAAQPYFYKLDFPGPLDRVPPQQFTVQPSSLATVTENYVQDEPSTGHWGVVGGSADELDGVVSLLQPQRMPGQRIQYLTGDPSVLWEGLYVEFGRTFAGGQTGTLRTYRPDAAASEEWNRYPLHPAPTVNQAAPARSPVPLLLSAARAGDALTLAVTPFSDSTAGHTGTFAAPDPTSKLTERYEVDQDGARLASGNAVNGVPPVRLSPGPSRVRFTLSARRTGPHYILSPASTTTWQWRSQRDPSAAVPPPWACLTGPRDRPALTRQCAVQPMMTLAYQVSGLTRDGAAAPGRQQIGLSVGHLQLAADPAITSAAVAVSFDDGKTWQPAKVTPGSAAGQYTASFTAPAGAFVTLRTTAADKAGGSVSETISRAYRTTAAAARTVAAVQRPAGPAGFIQPPCARPEAGKAQCFIAYRPQAAVNHAIAAGRPAGPRGLSAAALRSAYRLRSQGSPGQTVAVSIALHTPHLARYLAIYRKKFGLPPCTVASGCFRQVNHHGGTKPEPSALHTGWDLEATLDVAMVSAACPRCHILVVEGRNATPRDLAATERTAARLGAQVISNSYGSSEDGFSLPFRRAYQPRGRSVVVSSGDFGFTDASFPADLPTVISAGGTRLTRAHNRRGWRERVWSQPFAAAGSACSAWIAKPAWQHDTHCPMRTIADISAVATNVPVFNPTYGGWVTLAGTSVSAPLIAGIIGLAGNGTSLTTARIYRHPRSFFDVTVGSNTPGDPPLAACGADYMCTAKKGYDAPTGLGTPDGQSGL